MSVCIEHGEKTDEMAMEVASACARDVHAARVYRFSVALTISALPSGQMQFIDEEVVFAPEQVCLKMSFLVAGAMRYDFDQDCAVCYDIPHPVGVCLSMQRRIAAKTGYQKCVSRARRTHKAKAHSKTSREISEQSVGATHKPLGV